MIGSFNHVENEGLPDLNKKEKGKRVEGNTETEQNARNEINIKRESLWGGDEDKTGRGKGHNSIQTRKRGEEEEI